jgi:hypothetical protein
MKIIRLTNFDDWEAYYQMDDETDRWKVFDQGHHVRVKSCRPAKSFGYLSRDIRNRLRGLWLVCPR